MAVVLNEASVGRENDASRKGGGGLAPPVNCVLPIRAMARFHLLSLYSRYWLLLHRKKYPRHSLGEEHSGGGVVLLSPRHGSLSAPHRITHRGSSVVRASTGTTTTTTAITNTIANTINSTTASINIQPSDARPTPPRSLHQVAAVQINVHRLITHEWWVRVGRC
ncbi:hypothetical protein E2C01_064710 [Portunus trituberculatus]|uniref:Uncharacterized protein n=1 Tax=Portunus trituberculatus TaxID=210409 RepID=A0A5B7HCJ5_PORTR|nr:hypothetical protein [Portunus trituberculatus]